VGQVRWTEEAERWLREIHDYIARDNPEAALRTARGIYDKIDSLSAFPERGYPHTSKSGRPLRIILFGHYRIAYTVNHDKDVTVLGVFHGALDIDRYLP
jgi:plasmid stabilization system protein ParE